MKLAEIIRLSLVVSSTVFYLLSSSLQVAGFRYTQTRRNYPCTSTKPLAYHEAKWGLTARKSVTHLTRVSADSSKNSDADKTRDALRNARENITRRQSPGAGLATAEEQAEAAYADLINTSMEQRGIEDLTEDELEELSKGGNMWEKDSTKRSNKMGVIGDVVNLFQALSGGAHIEKNEFGET